MIKDEGVMEKQIGDGEDNRKRIGDGKDNRKWIGDGKTNGW